MRDHPTVAPLRLPILGLAAIVIAVLAAALLVGDLQARPPLIPSPIPREAFQPLIPPRQPAGPTIDRVTGDGVGPSASPSASSAGSPSASPSLGTPRPTPTRPPGVVRVVETGDTPWQIAGWYAADVNAILRWNPGVDPGRLVAGQRIFVPGGRAMVKPKVAPLQVVRAPTTAPRTTGAQSAARPVVGSHVWPLTVRGTIMTTFSAAHLGIDIATPAGVDVRAVAAGTVTWAGWKDNGGGYVVVLRHADGMISTYNHNRELTVERGQRVAAGETIARVGSTGWSTGPHLDLRIEMGGRFVDPLAYF